MEETSSSWGLERAATTDLDTAVWQSVGRWLLSSHEEVTVEAVRQALKDGAAEAQVRVVTPILLV